MDRESMTFKQFMHWIVGLPGFVSGGLRRNGGVKVTLDGDDRYKFDTLDAAAEEIAQALGVNPPWESAPPPAASEVLVGDDVRLAKAVLDGKVECYRNYANENSWYAGDPNDSKTEVNAETPRAAIDAALKAREKASQFAPDTPAPDVTEPEPLPASIKACREMLKSFLGMWAEERVESLDRPLVLHNANFPIYSFGIAGENATLPDWQALIRTARAAAA